MELTKLEPQKDERGTFVEAFKLPNDGQVSYLVIPPDMTRGNHYHTRKTEHFLVVWGSAEFAVRDRDTNDVMYIETTGRKPMTVKVSPNNTHSITATDEGAVVMIWCDEQYDKDDADTIGEEV